MPHISVEKFKLSEPGLYNVNIITFHMPGKVRKSWRQGSSICISLPHEWIAQNQSDYYMVSYEPDGSLRVVPMRMRGAILESHPSAS